jgi:uncharacterized protein YodC (DUF2158 family)
MADQAPFKVGDIVALNSGGPSMTVQSIGAADDGGFVVKAIWYVAGKYADAYFDSDMLGTAGRTQGL